MFARLVSGIFGTKNERELKRMRKVVETINALEPGLQALDDVDLVRRENLGDDVLRVDADLAGDLAGGAFVVAGEEHRAQPELPQVRDGGA